MFLKDKLQDLFQSVSKVNQYFLSRSNHEFTREISSTFVEGGKSNFDYDTDDGESTHTIHCFTDGNERVFIKFSGTYTSMDGLAADRWDFVKPQEVTVIQYVKV